MSKCRYCGEKAGLIKDRHGECEQKYLNDRRVNISNEMKFEDWYTSREE